MTQPPSTPPPNGPLSPQNGVPSQGGMPSPGAPAPQSGYGSPQGGYGAPQGGAPGPEKKPSKAPKVLIILGSAILALSVIIGVVLAVIGIGGVASSAGALTHFDSGQGVIELDAGEERQIFVEEGTPAPGCTVDGPAVGDGPTTSSTIGTGDATWVSVDSFTAEEAGEYMVDCGSTPIAVAPPISVGGVFAGIGGVLLAIIGGALGFLLLAIGVILLIVRKRSV